jgi:FkbM family methyltransferase
VSANPKKVPFDQNNFKVTTAASSSEAIELELKGQCEDGAGVRVTIKVEAPFMVVAEDGTKKYSVNVTSKQEVTKVERVHTPGGLKRRSDGLYWEIPSNFPAAVVGLLEHEPIVKDFLTSHFKENQIFVDVGANVGVHSVRAASWDMKVYAFEPNPLNLALLKRNVEINGLPMNILPYALGAKTEKVHLSPNAALSRIIEKDGMDVEMRTLDSFELPGVDLLKVDVEGYELEVLKGAKNTLEKFRPVIMIEMHYWVGAESEAELFQILLGLGYKLRYLDRYGKGMHLAAIPRRTDVPSAALEGRQSD